MHLATAAGLILALAVLARRGWVRLFGPVLFYEGLRAARRPRFFFLRWLYAVGLLLLLLWVHWIWTMNSGNEVVAAEQAYKQQARLAQDFFYAFAIVQFAIVVLLTPAFVAGGIAEEKERRTLEFLLATDLRSREIIFGKLLARLGNLALFVMTGLPVLSLMQFFGGIDPEMLLASFAVTAMTAGSLAALGILISVQRRRAGDAIILTYLAAAGYAAVASLTLLVPPLWIEYHREFRETRMPSGGARLQPVSPPYIVEIETTVNWLNAGNPFYGLGRVIVAVDTGSPPVGDVIEEVVKRFAVFHGLFIAACVSFAVQRLRPVALRKWEAPEKTALASVRPAAVAGPAVADDLEGGAGRRRIAVWVDGPHFHRPCGGDQLHSGRRLFLHRNRRPHRQPAGRRRHRLDGTGLVDLSTSSRSSGKVHSRLAAGGQSDYFISHAPWRGRQGRRGVRQRAGPGHADKPDDDAADDHGNRLGQSDRKHLQCAVVSSLAGGRVGNRPDHWRRRNTGGPGGGPVVDPGGVHRGTGALLLRPVQDHVAGHDLGNLRDAVLARRSLGLHGDVLLCPVDSGVRPHHR